MGKTIFGVTVFGVCARDFSFPEISRHLGNAEVLCHSPLLSLTKIPLPSEFLSESLEFSLMDLSIQSRLANVSDGLDFIWKGSQKFSLSPLCGFPW